MNIVFSGTSSRRAYLWMLPMWWMAPPTASSNAVQPQVKYSFSVRGGTSLSGRRSWMTVLSLAKSTVETSASPGLLLLLCDHGVEAADGVRLQPRHRAAAIQNKNQFRHKKALLRLICALIVAHPKEGLVACGATFMSKEKIPLSAEMLAINLIHRFHIHAQRMV